MVYISLRGTKEMVVKSSNFITLHDSKLKGFCESIRESGVLVRELEVEYHKKNNVVLTRVDGETSLALTNSFLDSIADQMIQLRQEILLPLIKSVNHNFILKMEIDAKGNFSFDNLTIVFKIDCKKRGTLHDTFRIPFKILIPFTEYIDYLSLRGNEYELSVIEAEVNVGKEDLLDVLEMPLAGPVAKEQWYNFIVEAVKEAETEYKLDVVIPVREGEVYWAVPQRKKLQLRELCMKVNVQ